MITAAASEMRLRKKITSNRRMAVKTDQQMAEHGNHQFALQPHVSDRAFKRHAWGWQAGLVPTPRNTQRL